MGLCALFLLLHGAFGSVPVSVRPSIVGTDVEAQYLEVARSGTVPTAPMVCEDFWTDQARLCFRLVNGKRREWVTSTHLETWGVDFASLKSTVINRAKSHVTQQLKSVPIGGMEQTYFAATNVDGWASAVLLLPEQLRRVGTQNVLVAVPAHGVVLAWEGGHPEVDKVLAVGVREIYESRAGSVSAMIYRWTGTEWAPFGEAKSTAPRTQKKTLSE